MFRYIFILYQSKAQILSVQQCQILLYTLKFRIFILVFAIYQVAYGVGFTLLGLPIVKWISNLKNNNISTTIFQCTQAHWVWVDAQLS